MKYSLFLLTFFFFYFIMTKGTKTKYTIYSEGADLRGVLVYICVIAFLFPKARTTKATASLKLIQVYS